MVILISKKLKKYIMKKNIKNFLLMISAVSMLWSCTDKFEEYNKNPYGVTDAEIANGLVPALFLQTQKNIYVYQPAWVTQLQEDLIGDIYSGYMMSPTPFASNSNNTTYNLVDGWNTWAFQPAYDNIMNPMSKVEAISKDEHDDVYAVAKILKVMGMHRTSDKFGPIMYTQYKKPSADGFYDYDSQEEAYNAFFADLTEAIDKLTPIVQANTPAYAQITSSDLAYGGNLKKWLKLANTLRLRLAIRVSVVNPGKAKTEGEAALSNPIGLLETNADNFLIDIGSTVHPLNVMNNDWGDIRIGAPLESILGGYDDPRLPKYAVPATDAAVAGQFKGIRQGINIDAKSRYSDYSKLATFPNKIQLLVASEAWFLKAEAALRSWSGAGDAKTNYEKGIQTSFDQYGLSASFVGYKDDATSKPEQYIDPKAVNAGENNVLNGNANLSTITIKWDDAATFEQKLERIITQKWIAIFPDGQEAWSEFRRTGYPKLFPVIVNTSGGKVPTNKFIRRINFTAGEYATNKPAVDRAIEKLGGPDTGGTPLWWDKR
jgi:hypothetical protein